ISVAIDELPTISNALQQSSSPDAVAHDSSLLAEVVVPKSEASAQISEAVELPEETEPDDVVDIPWTTEPLGEFLVEGSVVAVTGIIYHPDDGHRIVQKELARMLEDHGLHYDRNLTQHRTTLLLVGDTSKITRQITTAIEYGKPIFPAVDFFTWLGQQQAPAETHEPIPPQTPEVPAPPEVSIAPTAVAPSQQPQAEQTPPPPPVVHSPPAPTPPTTHSPTARPNHVPIDNPEIPGPWWVRLPLGKFLFIVAGIPLGLTFIVPIFFMIIGPIVPSAETIMTSIAVIAVLCGFFSVPAALVFVG